MKIVLFRRNGVIAPHITDDYAAAFEQLGHEILYVRLEEGFGLSEIQNIRDFKPDMAVAYGGVGILRDGKKILLARWGFPLFLCIMIILFFQWMRSWKQNSKSIHRIIIILCGINIVYSCSSNEILRMYIQ